MMALGVVGFFAASAQQPQLVDGVTAVVGRNIVLKSDIDQQIENFKRQQVPGQEITRCSVFEDLLMEKLLLHQADLDSIAVSDEEVQMNIDRRIGVFVQQIGSRQKLEQYYKKSIVEIKEEMEPYVRDQMTAQRMLQSITKDVEITPTEVRQFFKKIPADSLPLINTQMEYAQIVDYPEPSKEAVQATVDRLKELKNRVKEGSSFSTMAVLYSEDPGSAKSGGLYEGIERGQFVKEFEAVAFNLKEGEISDPFRSEYGYHIVQLIKRRGEELDLRHILIKPKISPANLEQTQEYLDSVRTLIVQDKISFDDAAARFSDDEDTRLNGGIVMNPQTGDSRWETGQMDKQIFYALETMEEGDISEPKFFRGPDGKEDYRLLRLKVETEPHRADLKTDYQRIQQMALQEKQDRVLQEWISDKLKTTYVRVNNEYLQCDFKNDWIKKSQYVE